MAENVLIRFGNRIIDSLGRSLALVTAPDPSHHAWLFREARLVSPESLEAARRWVRGLRAEGGTEMATPLNEALDGRETHERLRQVVFLTDGAVGNEDQLFRLIRARLGASRLFTVGIGAAPNAHFMTRANETAS